jgi:hypothetical protein
MELHGFWGEIDERLWEISRRLRGADEGLQEAIDNLRETEEWLTELEKQLKETGTTTITRKAPGT